MHVQYCVFIVLIVLIPSEFKLKSGSDLLEYWQIAKRNFKHRLYVHEKITYLILLIIMNLTYHYSKEGVFQKGLSCISLFLRRTIGGGLTYLLKNRNQDQAVKAGTAHWEHKAYRAPNKYNLGTVANYHRSLKIKGEGKDT